MILERFLSLTEAADRLGVSEDRVHSLIDSGDLQAAVLPGGDVGVSEGSIEKLSPKELLPQYKRFSHLKGMSIWLSEASRKYGVSKPALFRWISKGYITKLGVQGNKLLIDEADVAYCVEVYNDRSGGQGKWLFNSDGTPYHPQPAMAHVSAAVNHPRRRAY